jgi:hypothetical protein
MNPRSLPCSRGTASVLALCVCITAPILPSAIFAQAKSHTTTVSYSGVTLEFDPSLSKEYLAGIVPAVPLENPSDKPDGVAPRHVMISLKDSYAARLGRDPSSPYAVPQIFVFPTSDASDPRFDEEFPTLRRAVADLNKLLARRAGSVTESIPFLPWADERQAFIGRKKLIRFRNGRGVLFLTQYDQEKSPVNNGSLVYTFQGLTDDNAWYVSAVFPVAAPGLPASAAVDNPPGFGAGYSEHIRKTTDRLNRLPAKKFTPGLGLLEEIVRSLKVGPR